jgi:2-polyprenyl-3-methyl-5-hydroxy-6-metoxy-1,4-benzoquinol methylase
MNNQINSCIVCDSEENQVIADRIREKDHKVLKCNNCGFIYLEDYEEIDYSSGYESLVYSKEMDRTKQVKIRSDSLSRFNKIVVDLIRLNEKYKKGNNKVLEIGAGGGASVYGLSKFIPNIEVDCVEMNEHDRAYLSKEFSVKVYESIDDIDTTIYDIIFGHHVFEHFIDPYEVLNKISSFSTENCKLYLSLPNYNDFYNATLNDEMHKKYLEFNYHLAHPYYYNLKTFSKLVDKTSWEIEDITTVQDYSIVNYFNWYINGKRSKDIFSGTVVNDSIRELNCFFIETTEKNNMGNNISVVLKKRSS